MQSQGGEVLSCAAMQVCLRTLVEIRDLGADNHVLRVEGDFGTVLPGQFAMLSLPEAWPVLLPRPFSFFDVEAPSATHAGQASFFVKAIGPGSRALVLAGEGAQVRVTGPLGGTFPQQEARSGSAAGREPVCIAGGVGLAPFLLWCKHRQRAGAGPVPLLYGGASAEAIVARELFAEGAQEFFVSTDDGSLGFRGNVLELYRHLCAEGRVDPAAPVLCCGPDPMMHAVARHCRDRGVPCHLSLETYMACGYGVCNGCSVEVHDRGRFAGKRYAKTCIAGPVFDAEELVL